VCPALALVVLLSLTRLPATAQQAETLPAPEPLPAPAKEPASGPPAESARAPSLRPEGWPAAAPPAAAPEPGCCPCSADSTAEPDVWSFYLESGPLFPVHGEFSHQLDTGWSVDVGAREVVTTWGRSALFAEIGVEYENEAAKGKDVRLTDVVANLPHGQSMLLRNFHRTRLVEVDHLGVEGGLGWKWYPGLWDTADDCAGSAGEGLFLIGRVDLHGGATHAVFHEKTTKAGLNELKKFETSQPNQRQLSGLRLADLVESHQAYFGVSTSFGAGMSWCNASVMGVPLGDVSLAAEVQIGYHWDDLGEFDTDATFLSVSPRVTLAFSF
jgi:hypothetical protein